MLKNSNKDRNPEFKAINDSIGEKNPIEAEPSKTPIPVIFFVKNGILKAINTNLPSKQNDLLIVFITNRIERYIFSTT